MNDASTNYHNLEASDPELFNHIKNELQRQQSHLEMIASENFVSRPILEAAGSILTNKYAEGYPGKRYYQGCEYVDEIENLARMRCKKLYNCNYVNLQPHSGSQANQAVFLAFTNPGDTFLAMSLDHGGHLTHGSAVNQSGKWFKPVHYGVKNSNYLIDYDQVRDLAKKHQPKLIIAGGSAYPRKIDFKIFKEIAEEIGALFWVDMAHISGLVAGKAHDNPVDFAHIVTSTTHKTLRGPRSGMILANDEEIGKKLNKAVFPGLQGGPLMHIIAAKAIAFKEASTEEFKEYTNNVIKNAQILAESLLERDYNILTGGTDTHMVLIDLRKQGLKGNQAAESLDRAGIACNKNTMPFDTEKPTITSGLRLGSQALTTRNFGYKEFAEIGNLIADILDGLANNPEGNKLIEQKVLQRVKELTYKFPIYQGLM